MMRRGFTLVEMLVATIVFLVGFVAVFGLFLGGMRFRKLAEDTTRASLAASCLIDEIRAKAGGIPTGSTASSAPAPLPPLDYVGTGFANGAGGGAAGGAPISTFLYPYPPIPGTWYRVMTCTDINGGNDANSTVLHLELVIVPFATGATTLTFGDLQNRLLNGVDLAALDPATTNPNEQIADVLIQRGIAFRFQSVITRRPSWMP
jgi:prepilin-type N-terminal cleavage/methylation domain-containing protein